MAIGVISSDLANVLGALLCRNPACVLDLFALGFLFGGRSADFLVPREKKQVKNRYGRCLLDRSCGAPSSKHRILTSAPEWQASKKSKTREAKKPRCLHNRQMIFQNMPYFVISSWFTPVSELQWNISRKIWSSYN